MPKYEVRVPEIHYQTVVVDAEDALEALRAVIDGDGDAVDGGLEYSSTMEDYLEIAIDEMLSGDNEYDWMVNLVSDEICQMCDDDPARHSKFIGDRMMLLCNICASDAQADDDE